MTEWEVTLLIGMFCMGFGPTCFYACEWLGGMFEPTTVMRGKSLRRQKQWWKNKSRIRKI